MILAWFENMQKADIPPEHIWEDPEGLEEWWKKVEERTERKFSGGGGGGQADDDGEGDELSDNELARAFKE